METSSKQRAEAELEVSWEERARIVLAARRYAGITWQALMRRLPAGLVVTEAHVRRMESGQVHIYDEYVNAVLRACGLPESWRPIVTCAEHITQDERLGYVQWHFKAEESAKQGEKQVWCAECGCLFFPWELRVEKKT